MEVKQKRLRLMRFWLFGSFLIIWAAVTAYIGIFTGNAMGAFVAGLPIWGVAGVAAIVLYFVYKAIVNRQPG
jgi:hypothetical protein